MDSLVCHRVAAIPTSRDGPGGIVRSDPLMGYTNVDRASRWFVDAIRCRSGSEDLGSARYREERGSVKPLVAAAVHSHAGLKTSRRPQVRLLGTAPGALLLSTRGAAGRLAMVGISGLPRRIAASLVLCALAVPFVGVAPSVASSPISSSVHVKALCPAPTPGTAECLALVRTDVPAGPASAVSPMTAVAGSVKPADTMTAYNPTGIQSAYALPSSSAGAGLTVAIVDAYDSPDAETFMADLPKPVRPARVHDRQRLLPQSEPGRRYHLPGL